MRQLIRLCQWIDQLNIWVGHLVSWVTALVVLPKNLTSRLLSGQASTIEFYENPSEQILPRVVWQGVSLLADGLSGVVEVLRDPSQAPGADALPAGSAATL